MDFAIASLFIMIGQLIRAKVKLVQKFPFVSRTNPHILFIHI